MAKITLGQKPKTFKRQVSFPMLDGTTGQIEMTFRYRTRSEFATFIDEYLAEAGREKTINTDDFSFHDIASKTIDANADYLIKVAEGWDLQDEFTHANIVQLGDEVPASILSIMDAYKNAVTEGRLGN